MPDLNGKMYLVENGKPQEYLGDLVDGSVFYTNEREMRRGGPRAPIHRLMVFDQTGKRVTMQQVAGDKRVDLRFGRDSKGELYLISKANGKIWKVVGTRHIAAGPVGHTRVSHTAGAANWAPVTPSKRRGRRSPAIRPLGTLLSISPRAKVREGRRRPGHPTHRRRRVLSAPHTRLGQKGLIMNGPGSTKEEKMAQRLLDAVVWAPSVHNTQPWWFGTRGSTVTVHADMDRRLEVADPDGREMLISCGAALYTLRLAARHLGHHPHVQLLSAPERPGLIADVAIGPPEQATNEEQRMYDQIRRRRTHRGGFGPQELSAGLLQALRTHADDEGVILRIVADPPARIALAALTEVAEQTHRQNPAYLAEMARWAPRPGSGRSDGVHDHAYPRDQEHTDPYFAERDFARGQGWGLLGDDQQDATGVVALLTTDADERADWLRAGQALQRVLLRAAQDEVSAAFHTQALEVPALREFIRVRHCDGAYPQMIMRLGITDSEATSVRRSPADVSRPEP